MNAAWNESLEVLEISGRPRGISLFVPVRWRVSTKSRRIKLSVSAARGAVFTVPVQAKREEALKFLLQQGEWLWRELSKRSFAAGAGVTSLAVCLRQHPRVSAAGRSYALECSETSARRPFFVFREDAEPVIFCHRPGCEEGDLRAVARAFAAAVLPPRVRELARRVGASVSRVGVRDQLGRWGSCSGRGGVSLNWRLVLLPPELQDHVILHELAHRWEMNHSDRFWNLLASWDPDFGFKNRSLNKAWNWLLAVARS